MEEWNRLVDKNLDNWEYYRDMYNFFSYKSCQHPSHILDLPHILSGKATKTRVCRKHEAAW